MLFDFRVTTKFTGKEPARQYQRNFTIATFNFLQKSGNYILSYTEDPDLTFYITIHPDAEDQDACTMVMAFLLPKFSEKGIISSLYLGEDKTPAYNLPAHATQEQLYIAWHESLLHTLDRISKSE